MKIKRLECPFFVRELHSSYDENDEWYFGPDVELMRSDYYKVEPLFHSDGYYLVDGVVRFEYRGEAFVPKRQESARDLFDYELEGAEYEDVNILSYEQSKAIETLRKVGLATDEQVRLWGRDYSNRQCTRQKLKWMSRLKSQ